MENDISSLTLLFPLSLGYMIFHFVLKAWVKGSTWIPIFEVDDSFDVVTLSRKTTNFMMGIAEFLLSHLA